jgi:hypothetical protein
MSRLAGYTYYSYYVNNIGNKSTDTNILNLGPISDTDIGTSLVLSNQDKVLTVLLLGS